MFREVSPQVNFPKMEEGILEFWRAHNVFAKSLELRKDAPRWVFYEGPPTANGRPHAGHVLPRVLKDLFPRYRTMKGYYVLRKGGWDTQGLPVELEVEKELRINSKAEIEAYGVEAFNEKCRESVWRYVKEWEQLTERIAFWIDLENAYITYKTEYVESLWWILKQLWDKGLIYQGYKVVPYCARCGTSLSSHEVSQGYRDVQDPSVFVKFPLRDEPGTYFLVWTTTPWTLPGNVALAVHPHVEYVLVQQGDDKLILAKALLEYALRGEYQVLRSVKAKELIGKHYRPLYTFLPVDKDYAYVVGADFVNTEEGTGIVHIAPAFGADDLDVGKEYNLPVLMTVDLRGRFVNEVTPWRGMFVKDADPLITDDLKTRGLLYRAAKYEHSYPFCWRCHQPLLYYAKTTWYIETTRVRDQMLATNEQINWYPEHIKHGRFGNWLETNVDWALGRERYWGTPLPIWECQNCGHRVCVGSLAELGQMAGRDLSDLDPHRPFVDAVVLKCPECGGQMRRIPEVADAWFDSGSMPVAQWHYPFENQDIFKEQFPADFICEAIDQTRGWFYTLHAVATMLFNSPAFKNCLVTEFGTDEKGAKMSKHVGNVVDPWPILNEQGADALRWYTYSVAAPWYPRRFGNELVRETLRRFLFTVWNTYSFFVTYARIDRFNPMEHTMPLDKRSELDRWVLAELNLLVERVDASLNAYDVTGATRAIEAFVDGLSNWYVRRSRRRFWKSGEDTDKVAAYLTLYECLVTLAKLMAPFTPFLSEEMYQNLVRSVDPNAPLSVHLCDFPVADRAAIDNTLVADVQLVRQVVSLGHAARNAANLKVRQPLAKVIVKPRDDDARAIVERMAAVITDELNVKAMEVVAQADDLVRYEIGLLPNVLGKKHGARFPKLRAAVAALPAAHLARELQAGRSVRVSVDGEEVELLPEEVEVRVHGKEGFSVAEENGLVVAVSTALTEALVREGLAREVVRRIQTQRKDAGFRIEDHIRVFYRCGAGLQAVFAEFGDYIRQETLADELAEGDAPQGAHLQEHNLDGEPLVLGLLRIEG